VYSIAAVVILLARPELIDQGHQPWIMLFVGMVVGYAIASAIPAVLLSAPDETMAWIVAPARSYLLRGRGHEALGLTVMGSVGGLWALLAVAALSGRFVRDIRQVLRPHWHWIAGAFVLFLLMSEWPRDPTRGSGPFRRLLWAWVPLLAGLVTFLLSGTLGFLLQLRTLGPLEMAFQNLAPAFVGLFAMPWALQSLVIDAHVPRQHVSASLGVGLLPLVTGISAGGLGGIVATLLPGITGGLGALVAGHAVAQRDERAFLVAQGANKVFYYVGALLLFLAPGPPFVSGGMASMLAPIIGLRTDCQYRLAVALTTVCGGVASLLTLVLGRWVAQIAGRCPARWLSLGVLFALIAMVGVTSGLAGLVVLLAATGIGLIPNAFGSRRANCLGILLLPMLLDATNATPSIADWLGLA
jgi:putative membrane protein